MRSAGCIVNDLADRKIDGRVRRTQGRPLITGEVTVKAAIVLFIALCLASFALVLLTNTLTIQLSFAAILLACCYPFMKRYTNLPQVVLGAAFAWAVPMAFAAQTGKLDPIVWLLYTAVLIWTVTFDTFYAMVDREDDLKIGVKSTAVLFGEQDKFITGCLQIMTLFALVLIGQRMELGRPYQLSLVLTACIFIYQQFLIRDRSQKGCFMAFLTNHWVGMIVFVGIVLDLARLDYYSLFQQVLTWV